MGALFKSILPFGRLLSVGWNRMLKFLHVCEYINTGGKFSNIERGGESNAPFVPTPLPKEGESEEVRGGQTC